jgi:hypothetical protein
MKKKGNLLYAAKEIRGREHPIFYWCKLGRDQYLVVFDAIFSRDPIRKKFAIVSEKQFKKAATDLWLQEEPAKG